MLGHIVKVNVVDGSAINWLVLIIATAFGIEELHTHLKVQLPRLVANTIVSIISLISMNSHTGFNVHHQNTIGIATGIRAIHEMHFYRDRRHTKVERYAQQFVQVILVAIDTSNTPVIFNAYHHIATIGIGKCHNNHRQCFCVNAKTLAVELLTFGLLLKRLYIVSFNHCSLKYLYFV